MQMLASYCGSGYKCTRYVVTLPVPHVSSIVTCGARFFLGEDTGFTDGETEQWRIHHIHQAISTYEALSPSRRAHLKRGITGVLGLVANSSADFDY